MCVCVCCVCVICVYEQHEDDFDAEDYFSLGVLPEESETHLSSTYDDQVPFTYLALELEKRSSYDSPARSVKIKGVCMEVVKGSFNYKDGNSIHEFETHHGHNNCFFFFLLLLLLLCIFNIAFRNIKVYSILLWCFNTGKYSLDIKIDDGSAVVVATMSDEACNLSPPAHLNTPTTTTTFFLLALLYLVLPCSWFQEVM